MVWKYQPENYLKTLSFVLTQLRQNDRFLVVEKSTNNERVEMLKTKVEVINELMDKNVEAFWEILEKDIVPLVSENNLEEVKNLIWRANSLGFSKGLMVERLENLERNA